MENYYDILLGLFRQVRIGLMEHSKEVLKRYNLPFTSLIIMTHIEKEPGITVSEISRQSGLAKSHVSTTIEEMSLKGLAEKQPDENDQRILRVFLTGPALRQLKEIKGDIHDRFAGILGELPGDKVDGLVDGLRALQDILERIKNEYPGGIGTGHPGDLYREE